MHEHGGPPTGGPEEGRGPRHAAPQGYAAGAPVIPGPRHAAPVPPIPIPRPLPRPRPPVERHAEPRHALRAPGLPGYLPPMPNAPRSRTPAWVLPASLCAVIVLASAGIVGVGGAALSATPTASPDRAFLEELATRPSFAGIPDDTLIALGHGICAALADGSSHGGLVSGAVSAGFTTRDARLLVEAATAAYCPGE
jgi:hypothetical protein